MEEVYRAGEPLFPPGVTVGRVLDFKARYEAFLENLDGTGTEMLIRQQQRNIECANRALEEADVKLDDIKRIIVHNIAKEDTTAHLAVLGFQLPQSTWEYGCGIGHLGASDHLVSLHHLLATGQLSPGDHVLLSGAGPGLTFKSAVLQILDVPSWAQK
jgi:3-oxoacyl-[acyl-carrier-protein] synthase-3/clorobiocin biosynthesis protein CloN2